MLKKNKYLVLYKINKITPIINLYFCMCKILANFNMNIACVQYDSANKITHICWTIY